MQIKKAIPLLEWLPEYNFQLFKGDLTAGVTVGIMLIPQGMAYAMLAGLPPIYGLYASIIPLIIYAFLGTSRQLAVGPVAMVSLLVATGVGALAGQDLNQFISLSILLSLMVGVILLLMGLFRLGFLVNFLSHPVISGFTSAAAIIIGFSQLKHLLGIEIPRSEHFYETIINVGKNISQFDWTTLTIGVLAILIIFITKNLKTIIPGSIIVVLLGIGFTWFIGENATAVKIVGTVPKGLPSFSLPHFNWQDIQDLFPLALTIALIGFMESIAVAKAIQAKKRNYKLIPNQELIALGLANIGGSLFKSFPITGGFSRTAVNEQSGANTGMASIISAILIAITLLFLTPVFYFLPKAILGAIIIVAVFGLIDFKEMKFLWKTNRSDFWMLAITFLMTLGISIEVGILVGVVLSLILVIYQTSQPHMAVLGKIPNKPHYRNIERLDQLEVRDDLLIIRFDAGLYFANVNALKDFLEEKIIEKGNKLKAVIIDAGSITRLDSSGVHALDGIIEDCYNNDLAFFITSMKGPVRDVIKASGLSKKIGNQNQFFRVQHAVDFFDNKTVAKPYKEYIKHYKLNH